MKMDFFTWHTAVKTHLGSIEMSQWHMCDQATQKK
jgi:hypothetical protein